MKKLLVIFFIGICSFAFANEFVVKRKKLPSLAKLKERCCSCFAEHHNCIADTITSLVNVQKTEFDLLSAEVDGESILSNSSKQKLQVLSDKSNEFQEKLEQFQHDLNEYYNFIKTL